MITTLLVSTLLILAACSSDPTGIIPPVLPHNPVNEGWKAIENYEYSYNTQDIYLLAATLDTEFLHHLLQEDWDDYNGDGMVDSTWGYDLELSIAEAYFSEYEYCEFTLDGDEQHSWPEDPSGESIAYPRGFQLKCYNINPDQTITGFTETGQFILVCTPDSTGIWHITHLIDQDIL